MHLTNSRFFCVNNTQDWRYTFYRTFVNVIFKRYTKNTNKKTLIKKNLKNFFKKLKPLNLFN